MRTDRRTTFLFLGLAAFVGAIAVSSGLLTIGLSEMTVVVVSLAVLAIAYRSLSRRRGARTQIGTPEPERTVTVEVPGETVVDALSTFRRVSSRHGSVSRRISDGLRDAAVAVLTRFEGDSPETAERRLEDGTWTDDPLAAAFLSQKLEYTDDSIRARVGRFFGFEGSRFQSGVSHTVAEIAAIGYESDADADEGERNLPSYSYWRGSASNDEPSRRTTDDTADGIEPSRRAATGYWTGIGVVALTAVGIGAIAESPAVVLAGVVGVGYAGFARAFDPPTLDLSLERELSETHPEPGDEVDVTVTITNDGGGFVPDLRIVDGVPSGMVVTEGASRLGTALRPGESTTLEYTVTVQRGSHEFDPALVIARDLSRSTEREFFLGSEREAETTVVCEPELRPIATSVPIRATATSFAGRLTTADGGSGTTFHSVREYRPSDPLSRIDWNRRAKTGELTTVEFHEERSARVIVLVDARKAAYVAPTADGTHAVDRSITAAGRIGATLLEDGHSVGLAGIGPVGSGKQRRSSDEACWLAPASGRHHELQFRELLATHPQFDAAPPEREVPWLTQLRTLRRRLSAETGIVLLSPLCDGGSADVARRLEARGHPVTVVSPDPTADETAGQRLAQVARRVRRFDLERAGVRVVDWPDDESIDETFARYAHAGGGL
ncbi:DUF58 domain-containing protein [Natronobacterium texcoconense]|uniref:Uncharacterized conserved protein, DUF58 family, contains vWF domain n=1 Tax=Natronobacterium texcoconense TaxID=1095778 RepID=A0A1H1G5J6_NATTX|nr:DUF58 domain-containing protein [Natronobacterium texcoconense]SDR08086.1 Uncharacterized conserved protein, DUF58 family, contains vWF domain [Natronobacterium texcoconense]